MSTAPNRSDRIAGDGAGDRLDLIEPRVALDDHVQVDRARGALEQGRDDPDLVRGLDLGQHDAIGRGRMLDDRQQVLEAKGRPHAIDPDHALDAVGSAVEQRHRQRPRLVLLGRDDRILEIDRDHVRAGRERLRKPVRPGPRHEQEVAPRLDCLLAHDDAPLAAPPRGRCFASRHAAPDNVWPVARSSRRRDRTSGRQRGAPLATDHFVKSGPADAKSARTMQVSGPAAPPGAAGVTGREVGRGPAGGSARSPKGALPAARRPGGPGGGSRSPRPDSPPD